MAKRKKAEQYRPQPFESSMGGSEHFTRIFDSMLKHQSFKNLSSSARSVYLILKLQYRGESFSTGSKVVCPYRTFNEYGIQNKTASRALTELEKAGFIRIERGTKQTGKNPNLYRNPSIYHFVSDWWEIKPTVQTARD